MIHELDKTDFDRARPLFQGLEHQLISTAILDGARPGRVFADDPDKPQTAFALGPEEPFAWFYLAGEADNDAFNRTLRDALLEGRDLTERMKALFFFWQPEDWREQLEVAFDPWRPIGSPRLRYLCHELRYDWRADIPEGFTVGRIDEALLSQPGLGIPKDIWDWMKHNWGSTEDFLEKGFGYATIHGDEVVSWSLADSVSGETCEIGIHTADDYRRRGLGAVTTAATVEHALSHGLSEVGWQCAENNTGSIRTAEKVGFEKERDYFMYMVLVNAGDHTQHMRRAAADLAETAEAAFGAGQHRRAASLYEHAFTLRDNAEPAHYHLAARAWAALGDRDRAFEYLKAAIDGGWDLAYHTRTSVEFKTLHSAPEWEAVLEGIQQNRMNAS